MPLLVCSTQPSLDVGVLADLDPVGVAAHGRVPPDRYVSRQMYLADHVGVGRDPALRIDLRDEVSEAVDGHDDLSVGFKEAMTMKDTKGTKKSN